MTAEALKGIELAYRSGDQRFARLDGVEDDGRTSWWQGRPGPGRGMYRRERGDQAVYGGGTDRSQDQWLIGRLPNMRMGVGGIGYCLA